MLVLTEYVGEQMLSVSLQKAADTAYILYVPSSFSNAQAMQQQTALKGRCHAMNLLTAFVVQNECKAIAAQY